MTNYKTLEEIATALFDYFNENGDIFNEVIEDLDGYNGYLGDDRYYYMDELDELYSDTNPTELLTRAFYGYDEDNYITDSYGREEHQAFNPNRDYFRYNGYGNLVSSDYKDYSDHLDNYFLDEIAENVNDLYTVEDNAELSELIETYNELKAGI